MRQYQVEFAHDHSLWPADHEVRWLEESGLVDDSWHNDMCPSWAWFEKPDDINNSRIIKIWCDAPNPRDREMPDWPRFAVEVIPPGECNGEMIEQCEYIGQALRAFHGAQHPTVARITVTGVWNTPDEVAAMDAIVTPEYRVRRRGRGHRFGSVRLWQSLPKELATTLTYYLTPKVFDAPWSPSEIPFRFAYRGIDRRSAKPRLRAIGEQS